MKALLVVCAIVALCSSGCAATKNTLAQDLAWERWEKCKHQLGPNVALHSVRADGEIFIYHLSGGELDTARACLRKAGEEQARRRAAVPPPSQHVSAVAAPTPRAPHAQPPPVRPGSEWAYRWESPQGRGTFVYTLDREEIKDGAAWYVVKSGTRELYYRKDDLAIWLDVVEGVTEIRRSPPIEWLKWPLTVGQEWDQSYTVERPKDRTTTEIKAGCKTEREESVSVPAGSFHTFKSVCRNKLTGAMIFELWYSPQVAAFVRERSTFSYGVRERELIEYRLR
jgi:hypothetical protein